MVSLDKIAPTIIIMVAENSLVRLKLFASYVTEYDTPPRLAVWFLMTSL
jgi:hypothetical protein